MDFDEIIKNNCQNNCSISWWPKFAYHYTDVENAVNILDCECLYSRVKAGELHIMANDNASRQVIDMTKTTATANVRFYFRPLTPTQYYNEGFKHQKLRYDNDVNANVPVPVFFLFNLSKMLRLPDLKFSERSQAGEGSQLLNGIEEFEKLDFNKIYSNGYNAENPEIKNFRHAEILYPDAFPISDYLEFIICRNELEKTTLLNLLKTKNHKMFYKYKDRVKICREDMFENNGLFITSVVYNEGVISISFSDTYNKLRYIEKMMKRNAVQCLNIIDVQLKIEWYSTKGIINSVICSTEIDYQHPKSITLKNLPSYPGEKFIRISFYIEGKIMCCVEQPLAEMELI